MAAFNSPLTPQRVQPSLFMTETIAKLNNDYGMSIVYDNTRRSPAQKSALALASETYSRHKRIVGNIFFLYFQKGECLNNALSDFFFEAKVASSTWVPKPRADAGTLPSSTRPPRASSPANALQLEMLLGIVLDKHKKAAMPKTLFSPALGSSTPKASSTQVLSSPRIFPSPLEAIAHSAALPASDPTLQWPSTGSRSKRQSTGEDEESKDGPSAQKRRRSAGRDRPGQSASAIDDVHARDRLSIRSLGPANNHFTPQPSISVANPFAGCGPAPDAQISFRSVNKANATSTATTRTTLAIGNADGSSFNRTDTSAFKTLSRWNGAAAATVADGATTTIADGDTNPPTCSFELPPISSGDLRSLDAAASSFSKGLTTPARPRPRPDAATPKSSDSPTTRAYVALHDRLPAVWPPCPKWLRDAPLAFRWEITRVSLHCRVPLGDEPCYYDRKWASADDMWRGLRRHDAFRGKTFPERPAEDAFATALESFQSGSNAVRLAVSLDLRSPPVSRGSPFTLTMQPIQFDQSCRLTRHFGADRFLQVLMPSPTSSAFQKAIKDQDGPDRIVKWLTSSHSFVGLEWRAFYTCDAGYRKPATDLSLQQVKPVFKDRVHLFAEKFGSKVPDLIQWLLAIQNVANRQQPYLKLFSRIQLGLSKTWSVLTFEPHQIIHQPSDLLSSTGKVMNDGIGLMSRSVARKIRDALGLLDIPCAVQGRIGSAKGMWLMDVSDVGDEDWIETYPSQRKWECDDGGEPDQRTLEIRNTPFEVKPAHLNLQFLPVLEDRAKDKGLMRLIIGKKIDDSLKRQFDSQKEALKSPLQFRQWIAENFGARSDRVNFGTVPFLGGLPNNQTEEAFFLLNSGFDPRMHQRLWDINWAMQTQLTETLKTKLNVRIGRSAYMYMVIDFWGLLEEGEIHVGFSNRFRDEDYSTTLLDKHHVLVARSPAHFVSDVQKVRAVFKPELEALRDVVIFPARGNVALADKLSGGDYDGDMAWVCWDPEIIDQFDNAPVPRQPDLSRYLLKEKTTFQELASHHTHLDEAVYDMVHKSFSFSMQPNFLGICTNFKEKLCYQQNSVSNKHAVILSTLLSNLVDQSKQGIIFTNTSWNDLRREQLGNANPPDPDYKKDRVNYKDGQAISHIIDYLKYRVAIPAIQRELSALHQASKDKDKTWFKDPDLTCQYDAFEILAKKSKTCRILLAHLKQEIKKVEDEWGRGVARYRDKRLEWSEMVSGVYEMWCAIQPPPPGASRGGDSSTASNVTSAQTSFSSHANTIFSGRNSTVNSANTSFESSRGHQMTAAVLQTGATQAGGSEVDSKTVHLLLQPYLGDPEQSEWAHLRASTAFVTARNKRFVWQMAGRQLAALKAKRVSCANGCGYGGGGAKGLGASVLVTGLMYAGLAPDRKFTKKYVARIEGEGSEYPEDGGWAKGADGDWDPMDMDLGEREMLMATE